MAHNRIWVPRETLAIDPTSGFRVHKVALNWGPLQNYNVKSPPEYFFHFYPTKGVEAMLHFSNMSMVSAGYRLIKRGEFYKYLGLRLAMSCEPR